MSYREFAKREFLRSGYEPIEKCEDNINKWVQECVLELLDKFSEQGHSGMSAPFVVDLFQKLALYKPIAPIMCEDDEWEKISGFGITKQVAHYQNKIFSAVFKDDIDGKPYYLDAIVWVDEDGTSFTGSKIKNSKNEIFSSRQYIKIPFEPKTFYIDVIERNDVFYIKDENKLKDVWEYYEMPDDIISYSRLKKLKKINEI